MEEEETEVLSTDKTVQIDVTVDRIRYAGMAVVHADRSVDLSSLNVAEEDIAEKSILYEGNYICSLKTMLMANARYAAGLNGCARCDITDYILPDWQVVTLSDGRNCAEPLARDFQGEYYLRSEGSCNTVRTGRGDETTSYWAPDWYWNGMEYNGNDVSTVSPVTQFTWGDIQR